MTVKIGSAAASSSQTGTRYPSIRFANRRMRPIITLALRISYFAPRNHDRLAQRLTPPFFQLTLSPLCSAFDIIALLSSNYRRRTGEVAIRSRR